MHEWQEDLLMHSLQALLAHLEITEWQYASTKLALHVRGQVHQHTHL